MVLNWIQLWPVVSEQRVLGALPPRGFPEELCGGKVQVTLDQASWQKQCWEPGLEHLLPMEVGSHLTSGHVQVRESVLMKLTSTLPSVLLQHCGCNLPKI